MDITLTCAKCGRQLRAKAEHAGKHGKCPGCGEVFAIPTLTPGPAPGRACPGCGKPLAADAVICVACGRDLRTGRRLTTVAAADVDIGGPAYLQVGPPAGFLRVFLLTMIPLGLIALVVWLASEAVAAFLVAAAIAAGVALLVSGSFKRFSVVRDAPSETTLVVTRYLLFVPWERRYSLAGYSLVYYDTLDAATRRLAPNADVAKGYGTVTAGELAKMFGTVMAILLFIWTAPWILFFSRRDQEKDYFFEVGFLGEQSRPIRLHQCGDSAVVRELAAGLSEASGLRLERRDRRLPD